MRARLESVDGEYPDYNAEVTSCVLAGGKINIIFSTAEDGNPVQGRFSLAPVNLEQEAEGVWIFPDSVKVKARFTERQAESEEEIGKATITGKLQNYRGKKVIFHGIWKDHDGGKYDFELEAEHS
jgi:hypothetical protein